MDDKQEFWALTRNGDFVSGPMAFRDAVASAKREEGQTSLVPERYRRPRLSEVDALEVAARDIKRRIMEYPSELEFEAARLRTQDLMRFTFIAVCTQWIAEGRLPGGLTCSVDKVDGHIWTPEEFEQFARLIGSTSNT